MNSSNSRTPIKTLVSIVVPAYNEATIIEKNLGTEGIEYPKSRKVISKISLAE